MINIKDTSNNIRFSTEINTGSKRKFTLMNEDYIILKFSVEEPIYFKLGDYADTELGLFELVDPYKPTLNESTGGYDYELRLDAYYWKWKNKMFRFNPEVGGSEASWKLTSTLDVHLGIFLRNLTALGYTYKGTPFEIKIDSTVSNTSKLVIYENINLIDALSQMAETWECEWWVEDNQICFGRCEFGNPVDFEIFENVENMTREESKTTYATRVYAFGSTRNIPHDYRPVDESVVVNGIVQKRLMMPVGVPYVDAYPDMTTEEAIEDVVVFEDIYPRRTGTMSSVTPVERTENVENEDGSTTQQKYTVYQFKDTGITFSKDYILPGEELRIVFQTGAMAGMDFAVTFNPNNLPEKLEDGSWNPEAQLWEIVRNEDYGRMLPADTLIPKNGDTYNLYGFDSTSEVFNDMVSSAEEELEEAAKKYVEKTKIDPNTYPCTMMSDYMYNDGNVRTNEFTVGARINLINPAYFENGRVSRVIGFEFDLDIPYSSPVFTIGETAGYSRIGDLEEKVDELTYKGQTFTGTGSGVYVIGTNDNTSPTNKNVYSALKVLREFVRYQGWVDQPVRQQDDVRFKSVTSPLFVFNELTTPEFVSGLLGSGTRLKDNHLELDEITVRKRMNVFELLIQRVRAVGGQLLLSPASIKIESVEELEDGYKCSFNTDEQTIPEPFVLNDQGFHQTFTGKGINRYWRLVTGVGSDYFILSKTDREEGSGIPRAGDEIILLGNRTDKARQSAMMLSAYGSDAPYLDTYDGIDSYDLSGKLLTREGNLTGIVDDVFGQLSGSGFYGKNVFLRGRFAFNSGQDVEEVLEEVKITANEVRDYITNTLPALFEEVDARIDGQVESFFENYDPTLTNKPASDWTTGIEKERHLNDTFTNNTTGASWKWVKDGNAYKWTEIADVATVKALAIAGKAQETADGKIRNFITTAEHPTPYPPYDVGDLWNQGDNGDIMCCIVSRVSGNYVASDWVKSNKYTDDAVAIDARNKANEARASAESAKTSAEEANTAISDMSSDDIISPIEKQALKKEWDAIMSEKSLNDAQADKFNVSRTLYDGAYNDLATFIGGNLSNLTTNWNVSGATLRFTFKAYYDARTTLLNNIAYVAKQQADKAESDAANAQNTADNAMSGLVEANKQITSLDGKYTAQQSDITNLKTTVDAIPGKITQEVSGVIDWTKQYTQGEIGNIQFGMVNLLKGSNVELGAQGYQIGKYAYDVFPQEGSIYTVTICYTLGDNNTYIGAYTNSGTATIRHLDIKGARVIETFTYMAPVTPTGYFDFYQFPNGTFGSKIHWAVLVEGNKGPSAWVPALSEQGEEAAKDAVDNLQIGSVNLVSRKMLLDMNNTVSNSAIWGQDADGIYLSIMPANNTVLYNKFNANTQYVISIKFKGNPQSPDYWKPRLDVEYADGEKDIVYTTKDSEYKRVDYISKSGKSIKQLFWAVENYGTQYSLFVYNFALYEGNKVLTEIPVATEDLQGQSNVNLVDGGKEVTVTTGANSTHVYKALTVPKLKPNTVYYLSFKAKNLTGSPTVYSAILYAKDMSAIYLRWDSVSGGILITPNNFTETEAKLLLYAGKAGSTNGNSVKFTEVMLVEGFTPPASYSPSPGDVDQAIQDAIAKTVSITAPSQVFKYGAGYTGTPTPSSIVLTANPKNFTPTSYQWQYLNGSTWTNISGATSSTYSVAPGNTTLFPSGTNVRTFRCICNGNEKLSDIFTLAKLADGATGQPGADGKPGAAGKDAYTVLLTNEAHTVACDANGNPSPGELAKATTDALAYKGTTRLTGEYSSANLAAGKFAIGSKVETGGTFIWVDPVGVKCTTMTADTASCTFRVYLESISVYVEKTFIVTKAKTGATGEQGIPGESINGKMLYKDPEFKIGLNGTATYGAQNGGGTVVINRIRKSTGQDASNSFSAKMATHVKNEASGSPYSESDWCLYIKAYGGTSTSHLGGFYFGNQSRANAVFIVKVSAKIPVGYTLKNAHNSHGTGYKQEALTSMAGTGKYETYIFKETCGSTGTFSTVNYLYLSGPVKTGSDPLDENPDNRPLEWFVDYATVMDQTADGYGDIIDTVTTEFNTKIDQKADSVTVTAIRTDLNSLGQVVSQQGSKIDVNTGSIDMIVTKNGSGTIVSIKPEMVEITGATVIKDEKENEVKIFGVGDKVISVNKGVFSVDKDGKVIMTNAEITGKITAKLGEIGPFTIEGQWLRGSNLALSGSQLNFSYSGHQVYVGSHPDMTTAGNAKLGTFKLSGGGYGGLGSNKQVALIAAAPNNNNSYAMAITQGMLKLFGNSSIVSGIFRTSMTGTNPNILLGNEHPNIICLHGTGNVKKVNLYADMQIGKFFFITSEDSQGFDVLCTGSERFYRNGKPYVAVQSNGQDTVLVMKVDTYRWTACQLPVNWLGTWNP